MSKIIGVDDSKITNISGLGTGGGGGSYDPVAGTGTFTETIPSTGLLKIGGVRSDSLPGYSIGANAITLFSSDKDGLYLTAQESSSTNFTKVAIQGNSPSNISAQLAIDSDGKLYGVASSTLFGASSTWGQLTWTGINDTGWTDISAGQNNWMGINSGKLYYLGRQDYSGAGGTNNTYTTPAQIGNDTDWVSISCGRQHTLAIKGSSNQLYVAGNNAQGRTGLGLTSGTTTSFTLATATNFDSATNSGFTHVWAGYETSLAIQNGKAFFAGQIRFTNAVGGGLSGTQSTFVQVGKDSGTFKTDWSSGTLTNYDSHLIDTSGRLWFSGSSTSAGDGGSDQTSGDFRQIGNEENWQAIYKERNGFSAYYHTVAKKGGSLYYIGRNQYSGVIDSTSSTITSPTIIRSGTGGGAEVCGNAPMMVVVNIS